ncbi:Hypothetical predicted protein [Paramuricea clavata]|uniref:Uncharacterized protein n=1 Tax=Paramuricea clavata TaxID=317549 RepID=A0A6S7HPL2_PARCT|nr:Hypothetical predicted protein [Paramuricea clavata]
MAKEIKGIHDKNFRFVVPMKMTREDVDDYNSRAKCHLCWERIYPYSDWTLRKVRDHCHFTGECRGPAHSICNLKARKPNFIPTLFYNLDGYDEHLFLPSLSINGGNITCIPLNETCLSTKEEFFPSLTWKDVSDEEYALSQEVFKKFGCKMLWDYSEIYLKTDIALLTDIFEDFRKMSKRNYGLDPLWYYTASGLSLDAALKYIGVELVQLMDPAKDMYLMIEKGIRSGMCMARDGT